MALRKVAKLFVFFVYITPYYTNSTRKNMGSLPNPLLGPPNSPSIRACGPQKNPSFWKAYLTHIFLGLALNPSRKPMGFFGVAKGWKFKQPKEPPKLPVISWKVRHSAGELP